MNKDEDFLKALDKIDDVYKLRKLVSIYKQTSEVLQKAGEQLIIQNDAMKEVLEEQALLGSRKAKECLEELGLAQNTCKHTKK